MHGNHKKMNAEVHTETGDLRTLAAGFEKHAERASGVVYRHMPDLHALDTSFKFRLVVLVSLF